jgi:radical SAM protein with 4Fe4S-binding SPASM domain
MNPKVLQIELTNACNLRCEECPHKFMERPITYMKEEVLNKAVELVRDKLTNLIAVTPHKDGEPLLYSHLDQVLKRFSETRKVDINLYTNGLLLTRDFVVSLRNVPRKVVILISYHTHNEGGKRNDYSAAFKEWELCFQEAPPNVRFVMVSHLTDSITEDELLKWKKYWLEKEYKSLDAVYINSCIHSWGGKVKQRNTFVDSTPGCSYVDGMHFFIGVTGNVLPCCIDLEEEVIFGNIMTDTFESIQEKRIKFYTDFQNKKYQPLCDRCLNAQLPI